MTAPTVDSVDYQKGRAAKKQHDSIVDWSKKQFWKMKQDRTFVERQWYVNLAFFFGKQHIAIRPGVGTGVPTNGLLYIPPAPPWRVRAVINRIRPTIRTEIAQLTNNKPNATVVPQSSEERDTYAAMAAEQVWEYLSNTKEFKKIIRDAVWWNQVCGNSYIKTWWDFEKGDVQIPETDKTMGEVCFAAVDPFHVFVPDLLETRIEEQPFLIHASMRSEDYVKSRFGKFFNNDKGIRTQETVGREILETAFMNLVGVPSTNKQNSVLELECWIKPGMVSQFPDGGMYTIVGDQIVQNFSGMVYSHGKFPFAKLDHIPSGKYYSTSSIEDLIPLQKEYNRTYSQIVENKNRMSKLQLMAEKGSVDARKITTEPGLLIEYNGGFGKPEAAPVPGLPAYVPQIMDRLLVDWNDISGQHEVTHGQVPPGVTAATAISYLQERDETKLSPTFDSMEEAIEKTASMALVLVHDYWTVEKVIQVEGQGGVFDSMAFKGSDLSDNIDVRVEAGSSLPTSKAARQAFIMDLMKLGIITPDDGLEVLDMGGMAHLYEKVQTDRRQVDRENLKMSKVTPEDLQAYTQQNEMILQADPMHFGVSPVMDPMTGQPAVDPMTGQPQQQPMSPPLLVPVNTWDNHQAHIQYHNDYRKSQSFEALSEETRQLFEAHVQGHIQALGIESVSMQPRAAAGLPAADPYNPQPGDPHQQNSGGGNPPGPMPSPESMMGGQ